MNKYAIIWVCNNGDQDSNVVEGVKERNAFLNELKNDENVVYAVYEKILTDDDHDDRKVVKDTVVINNREDEYKFMTTIYPYPSIKSKF